MKRNGPVDFILPDVILALVSAIPEICFGHFSFVKKLFNEGPSFVTVCPSDSAKWYPSPVEPVLRYAFPPVAITT